MKAIHRLTPGYLVELGSGAIPILYRCISHDTGTRGILADKAADIEARKADFST